MVQKMAITSSIPAFLRVEKALQWQEANGIGPELMIVVENIERESWSFN